MSKINVERIFLSALGSNQKLIWYLQNNINIIEYLDVTWPKYMVFVDITFAFISRAKRREMIGDIDKEEILRILERERPELYKTLMTTPNALLWMNQQIENFKVRFL